MNFRLKILLGSLLLLGSWIIVVLMFLRIIPLSFALSFIVYAASVSGLFIGMLGIFEYVSIQRQRRKKKDGDDEDKIF